MKATLLLILIATLVAIIKSQPVNLQVEYMPSPFLGVDVSKPRFSWTIQSSSRAVKQDSYEILVSKHPAVPSGDVWNSNVVKSSQTTLIPFAGSALQSDTSYYWKVRWYNNGNASPYSQIAQFDTGLYSNSDWKGAQWITGFNEYRKEFTLNANPTRARLYISGVGYYVAYVNGQRVGDNELDLSWTNYFHRVMYTTYDITSLLKSGNNAIGVMVGNGWWGQTWGGQKMLKSLITVEMGTDKYYVATNTTWTAHNGPITEDGVYNGETYDARLETPGWTSPGFTGQWSSPSVSAAGPGGSLSATKIHPIKIQEEIKPIKITQPQPGVYVYDFGQNFSGFCRLSVKGTSGTTVRLRHAELLMHDGSGMIYTANLRSAKATDYYTLKGDTNGETYQPRFTYHGFRFVELTGFPGTPTLDTLTALHLYSSVPSVGKISFQNTILDRIQHNIIYGQQSNLMSVPTDCDQRDERRGWMGDAQLSAEEAFHNFDMGSFYTNFVRLINDDQGTDGSITDTVPYLNYGSRPADPAWGAAYPMLVNWLYEYNGDVGIVKEQYNGVKGWIDYMSGQLEGTGIARFFYHYGDWVPPPPQQRCNESLTSAFYYLLNTNQLAGMAKLIGNTQDAAKYQEIYQTNVPKFNSAFLGSNGNYAQGYQTCNLLPLFLGIAPQSTFTALLNDISSHTNHLTTGILGTKYLSLVLSENGRTDLAITIALQITYPSWGYMFNQNIEVEATTLWELWDSPNEGPGMNSRNHIMFGSVGEWFYKYLAGIRQKEGTVGYSYPIISPPDANVLLQSPLSTVSATYNAQSGTIGSQWQRIGGLQCAGVYPNKPVVIDCGENGGVIEKLEIDKSCRTHNAVPCYQGLEVLQQIEKLCVGQSKCNVPKLLESIQAEGCPPGDDSPVLKATCSAAAGLNVLATVPVNTQADIHVNKLNLGSVTIRESGQVVWQAGKFVGGQGILSASETASEVIFVVGSGSFSFALSGSSGEPICAYAPEGYPLNLVCPQGKTISHVRFASYGNPVSNCNVLDYGTRHAGSSLHIVEQMCLHKNVCSFNVDAQLFLQESQQDNGLVVSAYCS